MYEGLEPILLFTVLYKTDEKEEKRGVYHIPQLGVGMEGFQSEGSLRMIARHIANTPEYTLVETGEISLTELTEEAIIKSVTEYMVK